MEVTVAQVRVVLYRNGMRELLDSTGVARMLHGKAEPVLAAAVAASDVTGEYERSLEIQAVHTDRVTMRVVADVPYALAREAQDRTLGRALDAAGSG